MYTNISYLHKDHYSQIYKDEKKSNKKYIALKQNGK